MSELTIGHGAEASLSMGTLMVDMERGGAFTRDFERKVPNTLKTGVSLSLSSGARFWGTCGFVDRACREGSGDEHPSLWGLRWATWSGLIYWGL